MLNCNRLKNRLWLWLAAFAVFPLLYAVGLLLSLLPAAVQTVMLRFFEYLPLLCLLWLPIVVYLLTKAGTTLYMPIVYYGYVTLLFSVAGPALPSDGVLGWAKSLAMSSPAFGPFLTLCLTIYWIWQVKHGNGTKQIHRRGKRPPKDNEKQLNIGEKYA